MLYQILEVCVRGYVCGKGCISKCCGIKSMDLLQKVGISSHQQFNQFTDTLLSSHHQYSFIHSLSSFTYTANSQSQQWHTVQQLSWLSLALLL
jgi:hypothetical protein